MKQLLCAYLLLLNTPWLYAQQSLQTPEQFLGYQLGTQFTTHDKILDYVDYLCKQAPARCKLQTYGSTYEGRPLVVAYISSEKHMNRLEEIRTNNLKRAGIMAGQASGTDPVIAWLSYNVHGNESVSSEAVMQVMYDAINPANSQMQNWLASTLLILDPCENPDGRERYVQWYKQAANQQANPSPYAWEHHEPWPGGRPNHYLFDLNRDWAWQTQKETKARIALYNQWLPHLHADFHEMGVDAPYYFSPAAKPFHQDITPWQRQFQDIIGDNNRKYFDANNWLYFTRESYDLFYPSYGDTWPTFNGAIGMTYEQGGSGRAGLAIAREAGDTLTLVQRVAHHYTASLATIEAIATRSTQAINEFEKYFSNARQKPIGSYKTYVIKSNGAPQKLRQVSEYLQNQGITFTYASKGTSARGFSYSSGKTASMKIDENDLLISAYQPKSSLLKVLFEPNPVLEDSLTYDITSWAVPYVFGVDTYGVNERLAAGSSEPRPVAAEKAASVNKPYAYLARWQSLTDLQFLAYLLEKKVKVRYTETPFEVEGKTYEPGTLIITRTGNEALGNKFDELVSAQAQKLQISLTPVSTGFVSKGADFGSYKVRNIKAPKVAVLAGENVSPYGFGEVWHYFEQQINYPVTVLRTSYFAEVPLAKYDVLILPAGSYATLLNDKLLGTLKDWVRNGGKLIAMESAASFLAGKPDINLLKKKPATSPALAKDKLSSPYDTLPQYGNREREEVNEAVLGSVHKVYLDKSHPLAFGYADTYYALLREAPGYEFLKKGWNVGILKKDSYLSGYVGKKAKPNLQDALILGVQELGKGQIIYMADNPLFRGFWQSGKLLFGNAVFLVGN